MVKVTSFDSAKYLENDEMRAMYLSEFLNNNATTEEFIYALNTMARSIGMAKLAEESGIGRESLYKTLSAKKPRFDTMIKIIHALGMNIQLTAKKYIELFVIVTPINKQDPRFTGVECRNQLLLKRI